MYFIFDLLKREILGVLLWLYQNYAFGNLGLAVIELTVLLRLVLLPFSLFEERSRHRYELVSKRIETLQKDFKNDPVKLSEAIRGVLAEAKVGYWSKVILLATQLFVLVLLYQVFLGGINLSSQSDLPSWAPRVENINVKFLNFDIGQRSWLWPGIVALILFLEIYEEQRGIRNLLSKSDKFYLIGFPLFSFVVLLLLPMVKSLFILTSMLFTMALFWWRKLLFKAS